MDVMLAFEGGGGSFWWILEPGKAMSSGDNYWLYWNHESSL